MKRLANYLLSHTPHGAYLTVALWSLRQHYQGPVRIHTWSGAFELGMIIAHFFDNVDVVVRNPRWRGHDDYLFDKMSLMMDLQDADAGLLMDADTLVTGSIDEIFDEVEHTGFVATQFNHWVTTGRAMKRRIGNLLAHEELNHDWINAVRSTPHPAFNVGVFGAAPGTPVLPVWYEWSMIAKENRMFIPDEIALQPLQVPFVKSGEMSIVDGRYNHSPRVKPQCTPHIWHGHGNCWTKPTKSLKGFQMWWPLYQRALRENWGGIADWKERYPYRWITDLEVKDAAASWLVQSETP